MSDRQSSENKPAQALLRFLNDLEQELAQRTSDALYAWTQAPAFPSTIGAHVRHLLDHVEALIEGLLNGRVEYDRRLRGVPEECDRQAGLERLRRIQVHIESLIKTPADTALTVEQIVDPSEAPVELQSTALRETVFVHHHAVHHAAMIAVQLRAAGVAPAEAFGIAPATLAAQQQ